MSSSGLPAYGPKTGRQAQGSTLVALKSHWRIGLYAIVLMNAFNFFSHGTQDLHPTFLQVEHGLSPHVVGTIAVVHNIGAIVGGIACRALSEEIGRRRMIVICAPLSLPTVPLWAFSSGAAMLALGAFLMQVMVQEAWGVRKDREEDGLGHGQDEVEDR